MKGFLGRVTGKINTQGFSFIAEAKVKKFQYIKLYHEEVGFVLAQIIELINEENSILCECEIIGYRDSRGLLRLPNTTLSHDSEVYNADSEFIKKVLNLNKKPDSNTTPLLYIGLLEDYNMIRVELDVKKLVTKHLAVLAKTGAGKSYTLGVIVEELLETGIPCLIIDPHGEYSSLKKSNTNKKELDLMHRYDVKPKSYASEVIEYSPNIEINPGSKLYNISINSLSAQEISNLTPINVSGTQLGILYNAITEIKKEKGEDYDVTDIRNAVEAVNSTSKYGLYACLDFLENINIFSHNPVNVSDLVNPGKATLLNLRGVSPEIQKIIVAKVCTDLFEKRKKGEVPPLFLIVEEAHNFCPERNFGESPSSYILRNIASEGRKFGLGLGIVSQRPARVDKNVLSQCNTHVIQKITNPNDLKAVSQSAENINKNVVDSIPSLPVGTALITGMSAKPILVDVRVKRTEHGGKSVSFNYEETQEEVKRGVGEKRVKVLNLNNGSNLTPFYLARVKQGNEFMNLLINEQAQVLNKDLKPIGLEQEKSDGFGSKTRTVYELIKSKESVSISTLFNSLNYSFQDINHAVKELENKGLVNVKGSSISLKNKDLKQYAINEKIHVEEVSQGLMPEFKTSTDSVIKELKSKGLITSEVFRVFIK